MMFRIIVKKIFIAALMLSCFFEGVSYSAEKSKSTPYMHNVIWGFSGGGIFEFAEFRDEINPGFNLVFSTYWPLPGVSRNLFVIFSAGFDRYILSESGDSYFHSCYAEGGVSYRFPISKYFQPYGGMTVQGAYFHIKAKRIEEEGDTFKPGLGLEAGILSEFGYGIGLKINVKQKFLPLSGRLYSPFSIEGGITFRYGGFSSDVSESRKYREPSVQELVHQLEIEFQKGNLPEAEKLLTRILEKEPQLEEAINFKKSIETVKRNFATGMKLYDDKKYLESMPFLEKTSRYFQKSSQSMAAIRKRYQKDIPLWERQGVQAYEKQNYDYCISLMRKILLIDPGNRTAEIYLPRAVKRKKALKRLQ